MRSPQFLEGMKQWMEMAINFRKLSNDFMSKVRNEMQAPSRDDVDTLMENIHHIEKRLLDRVDELSAQMQQLNGQLKAAAAGRAAKRAANTRPVSNRIRKPPARTQKASAA
jgi:hypothetical protein